MNSALIKWLYLPDFFRTPNSTNLISECLWLGAPCTPFQPHQRAWRVRTGRGTLSRPRWLAHPVVPQRGFVP